jgi:hypothetical protein
VCVPNVTLNKGDLFFVMMSELLFFFQCKRTAAHLFGPVRSRL